MKKTKIICTVGPSTDNAELLQKMIEAGMDLARFNFSHGSHADHAKRLALVRQAAARSGKVVATIADTKGPEMRLGLFADDKIFLQEGDEFTLTTEDYLGDQQMAHVNYAGLPQELAAGSRILLADGLLSLRVTSIEGCKIHTVVVNGGELSSRKRVACPGVELKLPFLSEQDRADILFAAQHDMDYIAASFVQKADDVIAIRKVLEEAGVPQVPHPYHRQDRESGGHQQPDGDSGSGGRHHGGSRRFGRGNSYGGRAFGAEGHYQPLQ